MNRVTKGLGLQGRLEPSWKADPQKGDRTGHCSWDFDTLGDALRGVRSGQVQSRREFLEGGSHQFWEGIANLVVFGPPTQGGHLGSSFWEGFREWNSDLSLVSKGGC
jgi:hypothetical protein